uniref:Uncharacterized protein n=1 Tax=Candidatus Kentrum sp. FW TaxID=2126338 RepID=A0A450U2M0_9GAMM|nr:MAG: hypothetical protein BECKFW1821C_GA0114237_11215 [Candidatus Kentron sp. FW]
MSKVIKFHIPEISFSDWVNIIAIIVTVITLIVSLLPSDGTWLPAMSNTVRVSVFVVAFLILSAILLRRKIKTFFLILTLRREVLCLLKHWRRYLSGEVKDERIRSIRKAIASTYFLEEIRDISGVSDRVANHKAKEDPKDGFDWESRCPTKSEFPEEEDRPLIVSNFVNYARMVKAIINKVKEEYPPKKGYTIFCFTTLSASLFQWFNFDGGFYTRKEWDDYLNDLLELTSKDRNIVLSRCLLLRPKEDTPKDFERSIEKARRNEEIDRIEIHEKRSVDVLKEEVNSWIWLPHIKGDNRFFCMVKNNMVADAENLVPSRCRDEALGKCEFPNNIRVFLEKKYGDIQPAYWLLPEGMLLNSGWKKEWGDFYRLGRKFCDLFHTRGERINFSFYSVLKGWDETFRDVYAMDGSISKPRLPNDFFYVAAVRDEIAGEKLRKAGSGGEVAEVLRESSQDIFCLGGSMDDNLRTIHLRLLDPDRTPIYFGRIKRFVFELLEGTGRVSECGNVSALIDDSPSASSSRQ